MIWKRYGSYGSRLHRDAGRIVGYAEWPDEATWRDAFDRKMVYDDPRHARPFDAVAEVPADADPTITMIVTNELLLRSSSTHDGDLPHS